MTLLDPDSLGETWASPDPGGWEVYLPHYLDRKTVHGVECGCWGLLRRLLVHRQPRPAAKWGVSLRSELQEGGHLCSPQSVCTRTPYTHHSHIHARILTPSHSVTHACVHTHSHRLTPRPRAFPIKAVTHKPPNTRIYSMLMGPFSRFASQSARAMPSEASPSGPSWCPLCPWADPQAHPCLLPWASEQRKGQTPYWLAPLPLL